MRLPFPARLLILATAAVASLAPHDVWGQRRDGTTPVPEEFRRLEGLGELRLKQYSIHGYAPLVVLLTEAPASASEVERRYRRRVTSALVGSIERLGVLLFSLNPRRHSSDSSDVNQMKHAASAAGELFRGMKAYDRPQVIIGFADGAVAAARLILRDSLSAALVALVPGTPGNTQTEGQEVVWQELLRPVDHPRDVLVLESMCNSPTSPWRRPAFASVRLFCSFLSTTGGSPGGCPQPVRRVRPTRSEWTMK